MQTGKNQISQRILTSLNLALALNIIVMSFVWRLSVADPGSEERGAPGVLRACPQEFFGKFLPI